MNRVSGQVGSQLGSTESSPAVYLPGPIDVSMGSPASFNMQCKDSGDEQGASTPASPKLSCVNDRNGPEDYGARHAAFVDSPPELNTVGSDPPPAHPSSVQGR
jgi:hypothetical protein